MPVIKVWSQDKKSRVVLLIKAETNVINQVLQKGSEKLGISGVQIVLNSDGSIIDEDEALLHFKDEVFLLLENDQVGQNYTASSISKELQNDTGTFRIIESDPNISMDSESVIIQECIVQPHQETGEHSGNIEFHWENYSIPWPKIPAYIEKEWRNLLKVPQSITAAIHIIVGDMREVKTLIPCKAFRNVAKTLTEKYPSIFRDVDEDGVTIGSGYTSLFQKLQDRNNYLNRPHKRGKKVIDENPIQKKKSLLVARAGCSDWSADMTDKRDEFAVVRDFINQNNSTLQQLKEHHPEMLEFSNITKHFLMLTSVALDMVDVFISEKHDKIKLFGVNENLISSEYFVTNDNDRKLLDIIAIFSAYFKENIGLFFNIQQEEATTILNRGDSDGEVVTPFIYINEHKYYVRLDFEEVDAGGYSTFTSAFKVAFGMFFILNLEYPKGFSLTLEVIQRYIYKIHPDAGTKSKKIPSSKKKVINFINKLTKYKKRA